MDTAEIIVVETTSDKQECLVAIAHELIEKRLVACAQLLPEHSSIYRWEGKITESTERRLLAKTTLAAADSVIQLIRDKHNYELPEIGCSRLSVSKEFADWVAHETT